MNIRFNDEQRELPERSSLLDLLAREGHAERRGIAVAVNAEVVPRRDWSSRALASGDAILVITAAQGG